MKRVLLMTDAECLVGTWVMTAEEVRTAEFRADGTLTYRIDFGGEDSIVLEMTWHVEDGMLVIDQLSGGERSAYRFVGDNTLVMEHDGESFTYRRT
jgi:hypothetical protein